MKWGAMYPQTTRKRSNFMSPKIKAFFDEATNTISFVVADPNGRKCAIVDSVLDFDYASGRTDTASADVVRSDS